MCKSASCDGSAQNRMLQVAPVTLTHSTFTFWHPVPQCDKGLFSFPKAKIGIIMDSKDQDQASQNMKSDLRSTLSTYVLKQFRYKELAK